MRYYTIDILRAFAAFFIVGCHLNLSPRTVAGDALTFYCDMFVGVFGAVSGFLLCSSLMRADSEHKSVWVLLRNKVKRLLPIYLFWTAAYIVVGLVFDLALEGAIGEKFYSLSNWVSFLFKGGASCHLWYVIGLFYLSVLFIVTWRLTRFAKSATFYGVLSIVLLVVAVSTPTHFNYYFVRLAAFVSLGAFLCRLKGAFSKCSLALMVFILALGLVASWFNPYHAFCSDFILAFVFLALCVNERLVGIGERAILCLPCLRNMAEASLGVYLVHPILCAGIGSVFIRKVARQPYDVVVVAADWLVCYLLSLITVGVIRRIGLGRMVQ